jgi:K+-transporting ATPase ATPase C chain
MRDVRNAVVIVGLLALICGALFPALVIGFGQLAMPNRADGSLIYGEDGEVVGSRYIGQNFTGPGYFHPRPSGAGSEGYDAAASSGRNFAPSSGQLVEAVAAAAEAYREENSIPQGTVLPADAATASASGLDPHISLANARLQAPRVADARGVPLEQVGDLIDDRSSDPILGFVGESMVNVRELNQALDEGFGKREAP